MNSRGFVIALVLFLVRLYPAFADISIERSDGSKSAVFGEDGLVYYEKCRSDAKKLIRGCSATSRRELFSVERDSYVRRIHGFYSLIDETFGGISGGEALEKKISFLKERLNSDELSASEGEKAFELLRGLMTMRFQRIRAHKSILGYLEDGFNTVFSEEFQSKRTSVMLLSFHPVTYIADTGKLYRVSFKDVVFESQSEACAELGSEWAPVGDAASFTSPIRAALSRSGMFGPKESARVWSTTVAEQGRKYRATCRYAYPCSGRDALVMEFSVEQFHAASKGCARYGFTVCYGRSSGVYYACKDRIVSESYDYIPRSVNVVRLGSFAASLQGSIEPLEAGESSPIRVTHPVLCQKNWQMENGPDGNLNEHPYASFSIYDLEGSFGSMAQSVYGYRAAFLEKIGAGLSRYPVMKDKKLESQIENAMVRLFVLNAVGPFMRDIESHFIVSYILPEYERSLSEWNKRMNVSAVIQIDMNAKVFRMALEILRAALQSSRGFIGAELQSKMLEELVGSIGLLEAKIELGVNIGELIAELENQIDKSRHLISLLIEERRSHGFGLIIQLLNEYLRNSLRKRK